MVWNLSDAPSQKGRVAIVTGANAGLGFETALGLAQLGAKVVLAARNMERLEAAARRIRAQYPDADLTCQHVDLGELSSVRDFAQTFLQGHDRLDLLINNAGIMMTPYRVTPDGFESQLAVNYIGHFELTKLLLPTITKTGNSRIISLASVAHRWWKIQLDDFHFAKAYNSRKAYGQSKLACLMFSYELARRLEREGNETLCVAAHPGFSDTSLFRAMPKALQFIVPLFSQSAEAGAAPTLYAALGEDVKTGDYCGPSGFMQYWGRPSKVNSNKASKDVSMAKNLWEETARLVK